MEVGGSYHFLSTNAVWAKKGLGLGKESMASLNKEDHQIDNDDDDKYER